MSEPNPTRRQDALGRFTVRVASAVTLITLALATARWVAEGAGSATGLVLATVSVAALLAPILWLVRWRAPAVHVLPILGVAGPTAMALVEGGLHSEALFWLPFAPLVGALFTGARGALGYGVGALLALIVIASLGPTPHLATGELSTALTATLRIAGVGGAIGFGTALGWGYERLRDDFEAALVHAQAESDRAKDAFVATVSHELRTPLTAIRGALGLLPAVSPDLPTRARELVDMANRNVDRLGRLVDELLDAQKLAAGRMTYAIEPVSLAEVVRAAADLNAGYAEMHGVPLVVAHPLPDRAIAVDPARVQQVLTNLLSNAVKHSPAGEAVTVSAEVRDGLGVIVVADRGPGIPEDFRERVFDAFSQSDATIARRVAGTGLGLHIARQFVDGQGGTIDFEPNAGGGTRFRVAFPLAAVGNPT